MYRGRSSPTTFDVNYTQTHNLEQGERGPAVLCVVAMIQQQSALVFYKRRHTLLQSQTYLGLRETQKVGAVLGLKNEVASLRATSRGRAMA